MNYLAILTTICALCTAHVSQAQNKPLSLSPEQLVFGTFESSSTPGRAPASSDTGVDVCFPKSEKCLLYNAGVTIMTRELDMPGGKIGAHSWIQVMEGLHTFTVGGHEQDGMLQVRIWEGQTPPRTAQSKDSVVGFKNISVALLPPPAGMTQKQWNERIKTAAREIQEKNGKVKYKLTGGDGGVTTGNCHVITAMVLERAAGKPYVEKLGGYNPKGLNPGWTYIIQPSSNGVSSTQIRFPKL